MLLEVSTSKTRVVIIIKSLFSHLISFITKERKVLFRNYTNLVTLTLLSRAQ